MIRLLKTQKDRLLSPVFFCRIILFLLLYR